MLKLTYIVYHACPAQKNQSQRIVNFSALGLSVSRGGSSPSSRESLTKRAVDLVARSPSPSV